MGTPRICIYCSRPIASGERVALCGECLTVHHEECWARNGRCSTFRCGGQGRTLRGDDVAVILTALLTHMNEQPVNCPFCSKVVYGGTLQALARPQQNALPPNNGLLFVAAPHAASKGTGKLRKGLSLFGARRQWLLAAAQIRARSCGACHRIYVGGHGVGEDPGHAPPAHERHCPFCNVPLWAGELSLRAPGPMMARFCCDGIPNFHTGWFGHQVIDRVFMNRWTPLPRRIGASSCPDCHYTEVAGVPVYHVF